MLAVVVEPDAAREDHLVAPGGVLGGGAARIARADVEAEHAGVALARLNGDHEVEPFVFPRPLHGETGLALGADLRLQCIQPAARDALDVAQAHDAVVQLARHRPQVDRPVRHRDLSARRGQRGRAMEQVGRSGEALAQRAADALRQPVEPGLRRPPHLARHQPPSHQGQGDHEEENQPGQPGEAAAPNNFAWRE